MGDKQKVKRKMIKAFLTLTILFIAISIGVFIYKDEIYVKRICLDNKNSFNSIAETFKNVYDDGLYSASYSLNSSEIARRFHPNDGRKINEEDVWVDCNGIDTVLGMLNEKYQNEDNDSLLMSTGAFDTVYAYYDENGNMMLYLTAKTVSINKRRNSTDPDNVRRYYLVYIDDDYNADRTDLAIETNYKQVDPLYGNWYFCFYFYQSD